ncbi:hypothetical protein J4Q44_G00390010 [Coregonus suidteri]|uniref:Uncharacterized protein n=1 Tax=Coregonus suidteri TaxID=861788 RepID=A0AAN8KFB1_9TELE
MWPTGKVRRRPRPSTSVQTPQIHKRPPIIVSCGQEQTSGDGWDINPEPLSQNLTRALGELRVAIAEDLKATIAELDTKIESTIRTVASQGQSIVDLEKASEFNAGRIDELEMLCTSLQDNVQRLSVKVVDLEGRSRRITFALWVWQKGWRRALAPPTDFFAKLLKDAMGPDVLASDPLVDRAHRALVPVPGPGQRPRPSNHLLSQFQDQGSYPA